MRIGKIIGKLWAARKVKELNGCRMLIVQPMTSDNRKIGRPVVAADPNNIGSAGDFVVYVTSTDAAQAFESGYAPVNASIVELIDEIS